MDDDAQHGAQTPPPSAPADLEAEHAQAGAKAGAGLGSTGAGTAASETALGSDHPAAGDTAMPAAQRPELQVPGAKCVSIDFPGASNACDDTADTPVLPEAG